MPKAKTEKADAHKRRSMVPVPAELYEALSALAAREMTSVSQLLRSLALERLKAEGLWPPAGK